MAAGGGLVSHALLNLPIMLTGLPGLLAASGVRSDFLLSRPGFPEGSRGSGRRIGGLVCLFSVPSVPLSFSPEDLLFFSPIPLFFSLSWSVEASFSVFPDKFLNLIFPLLWAACGVRSPCCFSVAP